MSLVYKSSVRDNVTDIQTYIVDNTPKSTKYFRVSDVPQVLQKGKNLLRITAHPTNLVPGTQVYVDVRDSNGNPIYYEIPDYLENDKSRVISIWVYHDKGEDNTPNGEATITLVGIANVDMDGNPLPQKHRGKLNVKWQTTVTVDRERDNTSEIIFDPNVIPSLIVSQSVEAYQNQPQSGDGLNLTSQTGKVQYIFKGETPIIEIKDSGTLNGEMVGGSIILNNFTKPAEPISNIENPLSSTFFSSSIKEVLTNKVLKPTTNFTTSFSDRADLTHTFDFVSEADYKIEYIQTGSNVNTENKRNFANITLNNIDPITGVVDKIKILHKSDGLPGDFELLNEVEVPFSSSASIKVPIPSKNLKDPKILKLLYLNSEGSISRTQTLSKPFVFDGDNVYIGGSENLISGSIYISNTLGTGIEIGGASSGFIRSVGFDGQTSASLGKAPGGFVIYSGSGNLKMGEDFLNGVGMQFIGDNDARHLIFTTDDGGLLDVKTDKFFIGTENTQFISGSDGAIEISSSIFHLNPSANGGAGSLVIGANATINADLTVDNLRTPASIGGVASTETNSSSSIKADGFARFVSASIGGWGITTSSIEGGNLLMKPEGILQTRDFASGLKGWKISSEGNGTAEFENIRIRGTLRTTTFEKESVNAVGGQLWVANATTITGSITATDTTMSVKNASGFSAGEILLAKKVDNTGFQTEYLLLESASVEGDNSNEDETFGRIYVQRAYGSGQSGDFVGDLASSAQAYEDGQVVVSTGKLNTGYIKMNANPNDTATPFIDIVERTGSGLYDVALKARLGDLSGLANSTYVFGNPNPGFGLATDNVFLQGGIIARTGSIGGINMDDGKLFTGAGNYNNSNTGFYVDSGSNFSLGNKLSWNPSTSTLTIVGQLNFADGTSVETAIENIATGSAGRTVELSADKYVITFDSDGNEDPAAQSITLTATAQNFGSDTVYYEFYKDSTLQGSRSTTNTFTVDTVAEKPTASTPKTYEVKTFTGSSGGTSLTADSLTLFGIQPGSDGTEGQDAVTTFLTNEAHTLPLSSSGVIQSYAGANTQIKVFEGITDSTSNYTYTESSPSYMTVVSSSNTFTITNTTTPHSGSVTITAVSESVSLSKIMSVGVSRQGDDGDDGTPGANAKTLSITADSQVFAFVSASATNPEDNTIELFINQQNLGETITASDVTMVDTDGGSLTVPTFAPTTLLNSTGVISGSLVFGTNTPNGSNKNKFPITISVSKNGLTDSFKVFALDGGADGEAGADSVQVILSNESHTLAAQPDGTVISFSGAETDITVFEGITDKTSAYTISRTNGSGVSTNLIGDSGTYSSGDSNVSVVVTGMTEDSGSVTIGIASGSIAIDKVMSLTKAKQGQDGDKFADTSITTTINLTTLQEDDTLTFTADTGLAWTAGLTAVLSYDSSNFVNGTVNSYNSANGSMSLNVDTITGGGTYTAWSLNVGGVAGPQGLSGANAKNIVASVDSQVFSFLSASDNTAEPTSVIFSFNQQNLNNVTIGSGDITITGADGTNITNFSLDNNDVDSNFSGIVSGSLSFSAATNSGGLGSDKTKLPVTISATKDGLTDSIKVFKVEGGTAGSDGTDAVTAFLTNEAHTFASDNDGNIVSFNGAFTDMEVFEGLTNVTSNYVISSSFGDGTASDSNNRVTISALSHDSGSVKITATSGSGGAQVQLVKTMSLSKSKQGAAGLPGDSAKMLTITSDSPVFSFASASSSTAIDDTIELIINQQNLSATVDVNDIVIKDAGGNPLTDPTLAPSSLTNNTGLVSGSITFSGTVGGDKTKLPLEITVTQDGLEDSLKIFKVEGGTGGTDGTDAINGFLSNESHTFPADSNGNIASFVGGTTTMSVFEGVTDRTSIYTYSKSDGTGVTSALGTGATKNVLTISALGHDSGSVDITATSGSGGGQVSITKTMSLTKARQGSDGSDGTAAKLLIGSLNSQVFAFEDSTSNTADPLSIEFSFQQQNLSGSLGFLTIGSSDIDVRDVNNDSITGFGFDNNDVTNGTGIVSGSITFASSPSAGGVGGNTAKLPITITATKDGLSDSVKIFKVVGGADGAAGTNAVTALLTNDSHTLPVSSSGNVISFAGANTEMIVFEGTSDRSSNYTFERTAPSHMTTTKVDGTITLTDSTTPFTGSIVITATSGSGGAQVQLSKTMSISQALQGDDGEDGTPGSSAKLVTLTSDSQVFTFASASVTTPDDNTIELFFNQQNLSGTIGSGDITITDALGTTHTVPTLAPSSLTDGTGIVSGSLVFSTNTPSNKAKFPITISVTKDGVSDSTKIFTLDGGADGTDGSGGITVILSNESHTIGADSDGTVPSGGFVGAETDVTIFEGVTDKTTEYFTHGVPSTGVTIDNDFNSFNSSSLNVTAMGHDSGSVTITSISGGVPHTGWGANAGENWSTNQFVTNGTGDINGTDNDWYLVDNPDTINVGTGDGELRNNYVEFGNNADNDRAWIVGKDIVAYDDTKTYYVEARFKRVAGSGLVYIGVNGWSNETTKRNSSGTNSFSSQHYIGAAGFSFSEEGTDWVTKRGYFSGHGVSSGTNSGEAPDINNPKNIHTNATYISPLFISSHPDESGIVRLDYIEIKEVKDGSGNLSAGTVKVDKTMSLSKSKQGAQGPQGNDNQDLTFLNENLTGVGPIASPGLLMTSNVFGFHNGISGANGSLSDFTSFLDSSGNFYLGGNSSGMSGSAATSGYLAWNNTDRSLLISGSNVNIEVDKFFVGNTNTQFISGSNGVIEISGSNFHLDSAGNVSMSGTVNASAGSIGGFTISNTSIASTNGNLRLKSNGEMTGSAIHLTGGDIAGIKFDSGKIFTGVGNYSKADTPLYIGDNGDFSLTNAFAWDAGNATLNITGNVTVTNPEDFAASTFDQLFGQAVDSTLRWRIQNLTENKIPSTAGQVGYNRYQGSNANGWTKGIVTRKPFQRSTNTTAVWDVLVNDGGGGSSRGSTNEGAYVFIGFTDIDSDSDLTTADSYNHIGHGVYLTTVQDSYQYYNDVRVIENGSILAANIVDWESNSIGYTGGPKEGNVPWVTGTDTKLRIEITLKSDGGATYRIFVNSDFSTPAWSYDTNTSYGGLNTNEDYFPAMLLYHDTAGKQIGIESFNVNGTPKTTTLSGNAISTGRIDSTNVSPTAGSRIDLDAGTFFLGGTGSNSKLSWNGTTLAVDGTVNANDGTIGGLTIGSNSIESSTNLASPDSSPAFELNSSGEISGSNLYVRKVSGGVVYKIFDTEIGLIEAKNIGRQVVNDGDLYYMTDRDSSTMILMKQWYFHLLPYETRLTISGMSAVGSFSTTTGMHANADFALQLDYLKRTSANQYYTATDIPDSPMGVYYTTGDTHGVWKRVSSDITNSGFDLNGADDVIKTRFRIGSSVISYTIPEEAQSQYCRVQLFMNLELDSSSGGGVQATRCGAYFKGLDIIATRPLSQTSMGSSATTLVSAENFPSA